MGCKQSKAEAAGGKDKGHRIQDIAVSGLGSKVHIFKQDPTIKIGYRTAWIPEEIQKGPCCSDAAVFNEDRMPEVPPTDNYNNFLYDPVKDPEYFDAVNTMAIVYRVLHMYRRALKRLKVKSKLNWQWGPKPINILPHAGEDTNAFYVREYRSLCFFYFKDPYRQKIIFTCRSHDVIAHETGHAVLDALQPGFVESKNPETRALHESFGDLSAIFCLLDQMDMCEAVVAESKGDLHDKSFLAVIGEEFGYGIGRTYGLRNADRDVTMSEVTDEYHDLSRVFTGAVYDILVDFFEVTRDLEAEDPAETLFNVARHLCAVTLVGFVKGPKSSSFKDIATAMMKVESNSKLRALMKSEFTKREIFNSKIRPKESPKNDPTYMSCGTMKALCDDKVKTNLHDLLKRKFLPLD